jgi:hypothetical protein
MRFSPAQDTEAASLCDELAARALDTDAPGLTTANLWLWSVEATGLAFDPKAVIAALFDQPSVPCRGLLEPHVAFRPWVHLASEAARDGALRLLTSGVSLEIAVFHNEPQAAARFVRRLFGWVGNPLAALASTDHRSDGSAAGFSLFRLPHWVDEGLALIGSERIGLLWFVGTD